MLRSSNPVESNMLSEDQWDYTVEQLDLLNNIRTNPDEDKALLDFIYFPDSPSHNRQALYLLGYERVTCGGRDCCGICQKTNPDAFPARVYNWDLNKDEVLETAKQHLKELLGFGITDCFEESIKAMAPKLDW